MRLRRGPGLLRTLVAIALLGLLSAAPLAERPRPAGADAPAPRAPFRNWVSYYGSGRLDELARYDLVNLDADADNYTAAEIASLKAQLGPRGGKVISYLNLGSCEQFRTYWASCEPFAVGSYQGYPDEKFMDVTDPAYRALILDSVAPPLAAKGVDGFYYDNVDVYQEAQASRLTRNGQTLTPAAVKQGVADLVRELRARYPNLYLVAQNGLYAEMSPTADADNVLYWPDANNGGTPVWRYADAEAHENVNEADDPDRSQIIASLQDLKGKGLPILLLDYPRSTSTARQWSNRTLCNGFLPYMGRLALDRPTVFPDTLPPPAPTGLAAAVDGASVNLSWQTVSACVSPPRDNFGVSGYRVYRDGAPIGSTYVVEPGRDPLAFRDEGLAPGQTYRYAVAAVDVGLNESPRSTEVQVTVSQGGSITPTPTPSPSPTGTLSSTPTRTPTATPTPSAASAPRPPTDLVTSERQVRWKKSPTSKVAYALYRHVTTYAGEPSCADPHPDPAAAAPVKTGLRGTSYRFTAADRQSGTIAWYRVAAEKNGVRSAPSNQDCVWW